MTNTFLRGLLVFRRQAVIFLRNCSSASSRVCSHCRLLPLFSIYVTWSRDSGHPYHLSAIERNPLAGSTSVRGAAAGDSFILLCLLLSNRMTYSFITTFNIIQTGADRYLGVDTLNERYINIRLHYISGCVNSMVFAIVGPLLPFLVVLAKDPTRWYTASCKRGWHRLLQPPDRRITG